jgi:hypothetical protein
MAAVLTLVPKPIRDTVLILKALLARALAGDIVGVAICFRDRHGEEHSVFTGPYDDPRVAASAALKMSMQMTLLQEHSGH